MTEDELTPRQKGHIEGFALACDMIVGHMTGERLSSKSYDPMTIEGGIMHSYAFDLKDGGRHHPLSDYKSLQEITDLLFAETVEAIKPE